MTRTTNLLTQIGTEGITIAEPRGESLRCAFLEAFIGALGSLLMSFIQSQLI